MAHASTPTHGKVCRTAYGTAGAGTNIAETSGWTLNMQRGSADSSAQGNAFQSSLPSQYGWSASLNVSLCLGNTQQKAVHDAMISGAILTGATALEFVLDAAANYYTGDMYCESFNITASIGDIVKAAVNLKGTGAITLTP